MAADRGSEIFLPSPALASETTPADDDFRDNFLVSYPEYLDWPEKDRIEYLEDWRRAWTNFESGLQQRGQRFVGTSKNSWMDIARQLLVPDSWSAPKQSGTCLVGGWREQLTAQGLCPTRTHSCDDPAVEDGFGCSSIYGNVCVPREPIRGLSRRCSEKAPRANVDEAGYNERRHALEDLLADCQRNVFPARFAENCQLLLHDAEGIVDKFTQRTQELAGDAETLVAPKRSQKPPKYCENKRVVRIYQSLGGRTEAFQRIARRAIAGNARVEVYGECTSACIDVPAMVPKDRVCVMPEAKMGFHLYTTDFERRHPARRYTKEVFSRYNADIQAWIKTQEPLRIDPPHFLKGAALRSIFQSCNELYSACRAQNGPGWKPSRGRPEIVPRVVE